VVRCGGERSAVRGISSPQEKPRCPYQKDGRRLAAHVVDLDQPAVRPGLKLLAVLLVDVRALEHRVLAGQCRERDPTRRVERACLARPEDELDVPMFCWVEGSGVGGRGWAFTAVSTHGAVFRWAEKLELGASSSKGTPGRCTELGANSLRNIQMILESTVSIEATRRPKFLIIGG